MHAGGIISGTCLPPAQSAAWTRPTPQMYHTLWWPQVDSVDEHGRQALSRAVHCNECETAELLLAAVQKKHGTVAPALNWVDR